MSFSDEDTLAVVVEREIPFPAEKIWRALTQPHLIEEWLMKNAFKPVVGHRFDLSADWGMVDCEVQSIEPHKALAYSWNTKDLRSTVTWTLTPTDNGTLLRMEQIGFTQEQLPYNRGASAAWPRFMEALESVVARLDDAGKDA
ncbi:SRPBCC family protein [Roseibium aggregatum]|uniref:SRPBCC family protein n=1 Tax=Roseibium aggregatum TaxID=187304 RepID=UPI001A8CB59C|nr:SRPBCC domain-containing protein [Roseibium aggregatum]MBN8184212.1 SRPBCC domain-containing protein [Roseibium aggregatum]UES42688.1 polyketide cyclase [Roseibium aggregatum]